MFELPSTLVGGEVGFEVLGLEYAIYQVAAEQL